MGAVVKAAAAMVEVGTVAAVRAAVARAAVEVPMELATKVAVEEALHGWWRLAASPPLLHGEHDTLPSSLG